MIEDHRRSSSHSHLLDLVCRKNLYSRMDMEKMFGRRPHLPGCRRLNIQELPIGENSHELYKKLVMQLRRYNEVVARRERPILPTQQAANEFVYQSLRAIAFESKDVQKLNLETLDSWFIRTTAIRRKEADPQPLMLKPDQVEEIPVISMETTIRIKEYSRRHLEVNTGILRTVKPREGSDKQNDKYEMSMIRSSNRLYVKEVRQSREQKELEQIRRSVKQYYQHKQKLSQNLMNCREYIKPDQPEVNKVIWNQDKSASLHDSKQKTVSETEEMEFEVLKENCLEKSDKESLQRLSTAMEVTRKYKFTKMDEKDTPAMSNADISLARVRTADPSRFGKRPSVARRSRISEIDRSLSQTQYIKNKLHHSLTKSTLTNQMLFQGLNENDFTIQDPFATLPEQGSSLLVNPFYDSKKLSKH